MLYSKCRKDKTRKEKPMKKIKVQDKSSKQMKVRVNVKHDVMGMPLEELAKKMNLKEQLLEYHYEVCNEYQNVDDIENGTDVVAEMLADYAGSDDDFYSLAEQLLDLVKDEVIEEIFERDEDAREWGEEKKERY
jgi:hypothetical protein